MTIINELKHALYLFTLTSFKQFTQVKLTTTTTTKMSHSGQIQLILGPMFSGKTTELIRRLNRFEMANHKCLVVKYSRDNRYETDATTDCILTHDRNSYMANFKSDNLTDIEPHAAGYSVIGIDEGQFVSR